MNADTRTWSLAASVFCILLISANCFAWEIHNSKIVQLTGNGGYAATNDQVYVAHAIFPIESAVVTDMELNLIGNVDYSVLEGHQVFDLGSVQLLPYEQYRLRVSVIDENLFEVIVADRVFYTGDSYAFCIYQEFNSNTGHCPIGKDIASVYSIDGVVDRPLIVATGIDFKNNNSSNCTAYQVMLQRQEINLYDYFISLGYDLIIYDYSDGSIDMNTNALHLEDFIDYITNLSDYRFPADMERIVLTGISMGGVVCNRMLRNMFAQGDDLPARLISKFYAIDSPQYGAVIDKDFQHWVRWWGDNVPGVTDPYGLSCMAAKQLLRYNIADEGRVIRNQWVQNMPESEFPCSLNYSTSEYSFESVGISNAADDFENDDANCQVYSNAEMTCPGPDSNLEDWRICSLSEYLEDGNYDYGKWSIACAGSKLPPQYTEDSQGVPPDCVGDLIPYVNNCNITINDVPSGGRPTFIPTRSALGIPMDHWLIQPGETIEDLREYTNFDRIILPATGQNLHSALSYDSCVSLLSDIGYRETYFDDTGFHYCFFLPPGKTVDHSSSYSNIYSTDGQQFVSTSITQNGRYIKVDYFGLYEASYDGDYILGCFTHLQFDDGGSLERRVTHSRRQTNTIHIDVASQQQLDSFCDAELEWSRITYDIMSSGVGIQKEFDNSSNVLIYSQLENVSLAGVNVRFGNIVIKDVDIVTQNNSSDMYALVVDYCESLDISGVNVASDQDNSGFDISGALVYGVDSFEIDNMSIEGFPGGGLFVSESGDNDSYVKNFTVSGCGNDTWGSDDGGFGLYNSNAILDGVLVRDCMSSYVGGLAISGDSRITIMDVICKDNTGGNVNNIYAEFDCSVQLNPIVSFVCGRRGYSLTSEMYVNSDSPDALIDTECIDGLIGFRDVRFISEKNQGAILEISDVCQSTLTDAITLENCLFIGNPFLDLTFNRIRTLNHVTMVGNMTVDFADEGQSISVENSIVGNLGDNVAIFQDSWRTDVDGDPLLTSSGELRFDSPCVDQIAEEVDFDLTDGDIGWAPILPHFILDGGGGIASLDFTLEDAGRYDIVVPTILHAASIPGGTVLRVNPGSSLTVDCGLGLDIGEPSGGPRVSIVGKGESGDQRCEFIEFAGPSGSEAPVTFNGVLFNYSPRDTDPEPDVNWLTFRNLDLELDADNVSFSNYANAELTLSNCDGVVRGFDEEDLQFGSDEHVGYLYLNSSSVRVENCDFATPASNDLLHGCRLSIFGIPADGASAEVVGCNVENATGEYDDYLSLNGTSVELRNVDFFDFDNTIINQFHSSVYMDQGAACVLERTGGAEDGTLIDMTGGSLNLFCGTNLLLHSGFDPEDYEDWTGSFVSYISDGDSPPVIYDWRKNGWGRDCGTTGLETDPDVIQLFVPDWAQVIDPLPNCAPVPYITCSEWINDPLALLNAAKAAEKDFPSVARAYYIDLCTLHPTAMQVTEASNRLKSMSQKSVYGAENYEGIRDDLFTLAGVSETVYKHQQAVLQTCNGWLVEGFYGDPAAVKGSLKAMKVGETDPVCLKTIDTAITELETYSSLGGGLSSAAPSVQQAKRLHRNRATRQLFVGGTPLEMAFGEVPALPTTLAIVACYPNPFNPTLTVRYDLPQDGPVQVKAYNLLGQLVAVLHDGPQAAGQHHTRFDGSQLSTGLYIIQVETSVGGSVMQKVMLLK